MGNRIGVGGLVAAAGVLGFLLASGWPGAAAPKSGDAADGKKLYEQYCATCHGRSGKGDGPAAAGLNPKPRNHTDAKYMKTLSDDHLFKTIKEGGAAVGKSPIMPAWGASIPDDQIRDLVAYLRVLCRCKGS